MGKMWKIDVDGNEQDRGTTRERAKVLEEERI